MSNNTRLEKFINAGIQSHYVFYDRLKEDGYGDIYTKAKNMVDNAQGLSTVIPSSDSAALYAMAEAELKKEKEMLSRTFGCDFQQKNIEDPAFYTELIQLLNESLNMKKVFERNYLLIQETKGQKAVFSFFGSYFEKAWNQYWPLIANEIKSQSNNFKIKGQSLEQIVLNAYDKYIGDIMLEAFRLMFEAAEEENGIKGITNELQDAYKELLNSINQSGSKVANNPLLKEFYDIYKLEDIKNSLTQMVSYGKTQSNRRKNVNLNKSDLKKLTDVANSDLYRRGGLSLEAIENKIVSTILGELSKTNGISVGSYRTGASGMKADNIFTIGFNDTEIEKIVNKNMSDPIDRSVRVENIKKIREVNERLQNVNNGFIIYSSDKNYTVNDNFSGRGGFGGNEQSFQNFLNTMNLTTRTINKNFDMMLGAILQSCQGAINSGVSLQPWREKIAQDVAFMLFDDFDTIGKDMTNTGVNSIHIMNLDGIMLPLSFILFLMSQAIKKGEQDIRASSVDQYVRVNITLPKILYSDNSWWKSAKRKGEDTGRKLEEAWENQRQDAMNKAHITMHFLKDFRQLIKTYINVTSI